MSSIAVLALVALATIVWFGFLRRKVAGRGETGELFISWRRFLSLAITAGIVLGRWSGSAHP